MRSHNTRRDKATTLEQLSAYLMHHRQSLIFSLHKIYQLPATSIMTILVIGITLSLPSGFYLLLKNVDAIAGGFRTATQVTLYLTLQINEKNARSLQNELEAMALIETTEFISRHDALKSFRASSGFGKSIDSLSHNPLPHVIVANLSPEIDVFTVKNLLNGLQAKPEIKIAKLDTEWLDRLYTLLDIAKRSVVIVTILFALAVLLTIGNIIRLDIQNRCQEIIVTELIGATNAFIRRPFLYGGFWYGLLGGLTAWIIVEAGYQAISRPLAKLSLLYQAEFTFHTFAFTDFLILISFSALLGVVGSWVAVASHLNRAQRA